MYCKSNVVHACLLPISAQCLALQTFLSGTFTMLFGGSRQQPGRSLAAMHRAEGHLKPCSRIFSLSC